MSAQFLSHPSIQIHIPTQCSAETMWGILIFLRFGWCVGQVGLLPTLGAVLLSATCQFLSASSLSAVATNGLVSRSGGSYYMLVKALGLGVRRKRTREGAIK